MPRLLQLNFFVLALSVSLIYAQTDNRSTELPRASREAVPYVTPIPFRFLITENVLRSQTVRHIEVFLEDKAFSKENLTQLFQYIADAHPKPLRLSMQVYTDWEQVIPLGKTDGGRSNMPENPDEFAHRQANFLRYQTSKGIVAYFNYYPTPGSKDFLTVELKPSQAH